MAEETAYENGLISNLEGLVTLTLNRIILHTVVHHSSTSTYVPNFIEIEATYCGRTDVRTHICRHRQYIHTYVRTYGWTFETVFMRSTL